MSYMCSRGHLHNNSFLATDCAICKRQERLKILRHEAAMNKRAGIVNLDKPPRKGARYHQD